MTTPMLVTAGIVAVAVIIAVLFVRAVIRHDAEMRRINPVHPLPVPPPSWPGWHNHTATGRRPDGPPPTHRPFVKHFSLPQEAPMPDTSYPAMTARYGVTIAEVARFDQAAPKLPAVLEAACAARARGVGERLILATIRETPIAEDIVARLAQLRQLNG